MKNLRYKGGAHVRRFSPESLEAVDIKENEPLVWDKRKGGVLEVNNATADKILELYPNDFEEVKDSEAEQLQMQAEGQGEPEGQPDDSSSTTNKGKKS